MDSASSIAQRIAGQTSLDAGIFFTVAMWTNKAEKIATRCVSASRVHRDVHRRSSPGEGLRA